MHQAFIVHEHAIAPWNEFRSETNRRKRRHFFAIRPLHSTEPRAPGLVPDRRKIAVQNPTPPATAGAAIRAGFREVVFHRLEK
jgi:hypothetical protein